MYISSQADNLVSKLLLFFFFRESTSVVFLSKFYIGRDSREQRCSESWSRRCEHANEIMSTAYPLSTPAPGWSKSHCFARSFSSRQCSLIPAGVASSSSPQQCVGFLPPLILSSILSCCSHHRSISRQGSSEKCPDVFLAGVTSCPEFDKLMVKESPNGTTQHGHDEILLIPFHPSRSRSFLPRSMTLCF